MMRMPKTVPPQLGTSHPIATSLCVAAHMLRLNRSWPASSREQMYEKAAESQSTCAETHSVQNDRRNYCLCASRPYHSDCCPCCAKTSTNATASSRNSF